MEHTPNGRILPVSPARRMVMEILHHARKIPTLPLARTLNVGRLATLRHHMEKPCSWMAIFLRAYGLLSERCPQLRRSLLGGLRYRLYEHPTSSAAIMVERDWEGETQLMGAKIDAPERLSLAQLDEALRKLRDDPVPSVHSFRQWLKWGRRPGILRRLAFYYAFNLSCRTRAKRLGTFAVSSLGNLEVEQFHPLCPLTTYFTFGPIQEGGDVVAKIIYDHRVMDGRDVARCLGDLDEILNKTVANEFRQPKRLRIAA